MAAFLIYYKIVFLIFHLSFFIQIGRRPTIYIQPNKISLKVNFRRFLDMEIDAVDELVFHVIEQVAADDCDFDKVVEFVVSFSDEHSLSQEILLKLSSIFEKDSMCREKYVIIRACALLFS